LVWEPSLLCSFWEPLALNQLLTLSCSQCKWMLGTGVGGDKRVLTLFSGKASVELCTLCGIHEWAHIAENTYGCSLRMSLTNTCFGASSTLHTLYCVVCLGKHASKEVRGCRGTWVAAVLNKILVLQLRLSFVQAYHTTNKLCLHCFYVVPSWCLVTLEPIAKEPEARCTLCPPILCTVFVHSSNGRTSCTATSVSTSSSWYELQEYSLCSNT
jgi:hypothetical protein